jgi:mono/diheme cytochrome c family protein
MVIEKNKRTYLLLPPSIIFILFGVMLPSAGAVRVAHEATLTIAVAMNKQKVTAAELLANPATRDIEIDHDTAYNRPMHYRAIPLAFLLANATLPPEKVIEAVGSDGFASMLPLDLALHPPKHGAEPFLAIEPPDSPWPALPGKSISAGPFYIVWLHPEASGIRSEQWPYMVAELRSEDSPAKRWPALAVASDLSADDPVRVGQMLFVTQCLVCHRLNGAGTSDVGPDLNLPENPTEYFTETALARYIRDPASLRHWSRMQMKGFDKDALSDHEIDLVISYLKHMANRKIVH